MENQKPIRYQAKAFTNLRMDPIMKDNFETLNFMAVAS